MNSAFYLFSDLLPPSDCDTGQRDAGWELFNPRDVLPPFKNLETCHECRKIEVEKRDGRNERTHVYEKNIWKFPMRKKKGFENDFEEKMNFEGDLRDEKKIWDGWFRSTNLKDMMILMKMSFYEWSFNAFARASIVFTRFTRLFLPY